VHAAAHHQHQSWSWSCAMMLVNVTSAFSTRRRFFASALTHRARRVKIFFVRRSPSDASLDERQVQPA
jgi:hypothetical protein